MKKSILLKLFFIISLVVVVVAVMSVWFEVSHQTEFMVEIFNDRADQLAQSFEANLSLEDLEDFALLEEKVQKYILHNPEVLELSMKFDEGGMGRIVASSNLQQIGTIEEGSHAENKNVHEINLKNTDLFNKQDVVMVVPWHVSGKHVGSYKIIITTEHLRRRFVQQVYISAVSTLVSGIIILILLVSFIKFLLVNKMSEVVSGVEKYGSGNLSFRLEVSSQDEIGFLARSFNSMADRVQQLLGGMEKQVEEKTSELSVRMDELKSKTKDQEDTQKAIINLLEDAKDLEENLKLEKDGVEKKVLERTSELEKQTKALEESRQRATSGWVQLQAEKARLNASIEVLPLGLIIINKDHDVIESNEELRRILGIDVNSDFKIEELEIFLKELGFNLKETCAHCGAGEMIVKEGLKYKEKFLKLISVPVILESEVIGTTYMIEDVTEAKKLQKTRDEFFSVASHELRTPLTAIRGNTQMLQDYYPEIQENEEVKEMVVDIHTASVRLIGIVNDFLDASRLELKKTEMKLSQFSLKELVEKTMEQVNPKSVGRELEYKLNISEGVDANVNADKDRLQQVLINLIGNAFKFTKEGGVYLDIENGENGFVKVKITDTGVGVSEVDQAELFAKFKQVGSNAGLARDVSEGTGMGLYISKLIMDAMGGRVYLERSSEGKGSTFVIEVLKAS